MISDDLFVYLLGLTIVLLINFIGYTRIPILLFIGLMATMILAVPSINAFGEYYLIALMMILTNIAIPAIGLSKAVKGD